MTYVFWEFVRIAFIGLWGHVHSPLLQGGLASLFRLETPPSVTGTQQGGLQGPGLVSRLSKGPAAVPVQASQLRLCFRRHGVHVPQSQVHLLSGKAWCQHR